MKFKSPRKTTSFAKVHEFSKISASSLVHSDFVKLGGGGGGGDKQLDSPFSKLYNSNREGMDVFLYLPSRHCGQHDPGIWPGFLPFSEGKKSARKKVNEAFVQLLWFEQRPVS